MKSNDTPDFHSYRWVIVNSSGGKDSQTALHATMEVARVQGYPEDRVVVSHQCLGDSEWEGVMELVRRQAAHYGLRVETSRYRNKQGENPTLLEYAEKRGKWPDAKNRYCTSEFKRGPGGRIITKLYRESPGDVLNIFGYRAQESLARSLRPVFAKNSRFSNKSRTVMDWLPIHALTVEEVWASIHESGVPYHPAYDLGMSRLSCAFCILASKKDLKISARANPKLLRRYVDLEERMGHSFQHKQSLADIEKSVSTS